MAQIPNLDNAPLNFKSFREQSQKDIIKLLDNIRGRKCLVLDPKLSGSLALLLPTSFLKDHGVEQFIRLSPHHNPTDGPPPNSDSIQSDVAKVIYLVRSQIDLVKLVSSHIQHDLSKALPRDYFVFFVPRRTVVCEKIFEEEKLHQMLTIGELPLYMIPLDEDVLSLELDLTFRDCLIDGDTSTLWHVAKAIHKLEFSFGLIPNVRAKGKASAKVSDILSRMQEDDPVNPLDVDIPQISTLILIDREVDMVTPMCTQLTYEGLLDELLRINNGAVEVDASLMGVQQDKKLKVPLNSSDKLYREIRDLNFEVVVQVLRHKATSMKQDYTELTNTEQSVSELKDFVKKLNSLPEMARHINLAQHLSTYTSKPSFHSRLEIEHTIVEGESYEICFDYIEEMIHKQEPIGAVLRLLVLLSFTNAGLPKKQFDYIRREILHSYGFEHAFCLHNLEKAGLLKKQESKTNWPMIKRALQLVVDDTDSANPNDIAYVFSGYAPLSIRLVQHAVRSGWRSIEEILRLLPGPHSELKRGGYSRSNSLDMMQGNIEKMGDGRRSIVLVVFVGGVTFAEVAALRFLSAQEGMAYELIVVTTKFVNGHTLLETFIDKLG